MMAFDCCSTLLTATERMVGRDAASLIACIHPGATALRP
jgi:hypothetical protein